MFWIELTATVFGFLCVVLTILRNVWCWPVGLVQVLLFIVIFYNAKLYSDLGLHVIYVGLQFYGWYCWTHPCDDGSSARDGAAALLAVTRLSRWQWFVSMGATLLGTLMLGSFMHWLTDASVPFADAFTTVASLVAQFLMARKKLESWLFWIAVDVIAIGIYYYKELIPTSILYTAFLGLAIIGYVTWLHSVRRPELLESAG